MTHLAPMIARFGHRDQHDHHLSVRFKYLFNLKLVEFRKEDVLS